MNKSAIKIVFYIFKYLAIITMLAVIVFSTDITSNVAAGDIKSVFETFTSLIRKNIQIFSAILFICVVVIFICNMVIHFMKLNFESDELDKQNTNNTNSINELKGEYKKLNDNVKEIKKELEISTQQLFEEKYNTISRFSKHYNKMTVHFERRKLNYISVNQKFYNIVKTSKNIDNETLQLIDTFEEEINLKI